MLGIESYSVRAHTGCYNALSLDSLATRLSSRSLRGLSCMLICVHHFNLEIFVDTFWQDIVSVCGGLLLIRLMYLELESCWTLVETGILLRMLFLICLHVDVVVGEIIFWRTMSKRMFETSVNSTDKNKYPMAISSTRKGRVGRELF